MPIHSDFQKILNRMISQYGRKKGTSVFYAWCKKNGYDYGKPYPKTREMLEMELREAFALREKPLKIRGTAVKTGISRNRNLYTAQELEKFAPTLIGRPIYIEHVGAGNAVGKVVKSWYDPHTQSVLYEGEILDEGTADQILNGLITKVSICADYDTVDEETVHIPFGLSADHLGLVAIPGVPGANLTVMESIAWRPCVMESANGSTVKIAVSEPVGTIENAEPKTVPELFRLNTAWRKTMAQRSKEVNEALKRK